MATIIEQIPAMTDDQLSALRNNAVRIADGDNTKQSAAARDVLTAVDAQIATRSATKRAEIAERRAQAKPRRAKRVKAEG